MYEELALLISLGYEAVERDPSNLLKMLRIYSYLFLNGQAPSACGKCHKAYFDRLSKTGLQILNHMANQEFKLKENIVIEDRETGELYSKFNMTDEVAIKRLRKYPQTITQFEAYPANWQEIVNGELNKKPVEKKPVVRKPRNKKA